MRVCVHVCVHKASWYVPLVLERNNKQKMITRILLLTLFVTVRNVSPS